LVRDDRDLRLDRHVRRQVAHPVANERTAPFGLVRDRAAGDGLLLVAEVVEADCRKLAVAAERGAPHARTAADAVLAVRLLDELDVGARWPLPSEQREQVPPGLDLDTAEVVEARGHAAQRNVLRRPLQVRPPQEGHVAGAGRDVGGLDGGALRIARGLRDRDAFRADREVGREELAHRDARILGDEVLLGDLAQLRGARIERHALARVGAQHGVDHHGAVLAQVVVDAASAQRVLEVRGDHVALEVDAEHILGRELARRAAHRRERAFAHEDHGALRGELQLATRGGGVAALVLDDH
jgi:hypothetical protein